MKRTLGLCILILGILIIAGGFSLTPPHSLNPADSDNSIKANAGLVFGGFITFGIGVVLFVSTIPYAAERTRS